MKKQIAIKVEGLSKQYRTGIIGTGTLAHDINRWWHLIRGKRDPYLKIGDTNTRSKKGDSSYVWALKNIDFSVKKGEILGIIGGNGAGKSTLLKILSQVTAPTTGSFKARGKVASLLEVGTGFHKELTGRENVYLNGAILGMSKKEITSKIDEIISFSGVERYIDTPVKRYSSGMKVRLAFAVAAHLDPEILIVDEVLAVGDLAFQKKAIGKIKEVSEQTDRTVLFVSHDMEAISRLCTKVMILSDGMISFIGDTEEGVKAYTEQMLQKTATINIAETSKRKGLQQIKFENVWIENEAGKTIPVAQVGAPLIFCLDVKTALPEKRTFSAGIGIKDDKGADVCLISSWTKGELLQVEQEGTVLFKIDKLPLIEGDYIVDLFMENGTMGNVVQDHVLNAFHLKVVGKDFYKSGQIAHNYKYKNYIDFVQEIRQKVSTYVL